MSFQDTWRSGGTGRGAYILRPRSVSEKPLILKGLASQTANLFEVQNSSGSTLFAVAADGALTITGLVTLSVSQIVTGDVTISGNLSVAGTSSFTGLATFASLSVTGNMTLNDVAVNHNLTVNNNFAVNGNSTVEKLVLGNSASYGGGVTNEVATVQTADATQTTIASIQVNANETFAVEVTVVAMEASATSAGRAVYHKSGLFYRAATGNVTQQGSTVSIQTSESDVNWDLAFTLDTTNQKILVSATGAAATTIRWKAYLKYIKVQ